MVLVVQQTEKDFQNQVLQLAWLQGWHPVHIRRVRVQRGDGSVYYETPVEPKDAVGFTDVILVRERVVFAELKTDSGRLRPEQKKWLKRLKDAGQEAYLWRPSMWPDIVKTLER